MLSGGELAAAVVIDAVARLLPGVLGDEDSNVEDSFTAGLLDCPQYTRPEVVDGRAVPEVLLGGDHEAISRWRLKQALGRTWLERPQLLAKQAAHGRGTGVIGGVQGRMARAELARRDCVEYV